MKFLIEDGRICSNEEFDKFQKAHSKFKQSLNYINENKHLFTLLGYNNKVLEQLLEEINLNTNKTDIFKIEKEMYA